MIHPIVFEPARPVARALVFALATTVASALAGSGALAQAPAPAPKADQKGKALSKPLPKASTPAAPAAAPAVEDDATVVFEIVIDDYAATLPLSYSASDDVDLASSKARHYPDPEHKLDAWVKSLLEKTQGNGTLDVLMAMIAAIKELPATLRRTVTWDQGHEMAQHARISVDTGVQVYFCDPHSPWQRGSNENTNGLLRQYFPRGTDLSVHSAEHLAYVADELNGRPRKRYDWDNPANRLNKLLSSPTETTVATKP